MCFPGRRADLRAPIRVHACRPRQRRCTLAPTREPDAAGEKTAAGEQ
ncbi:hypothetical protein HMPREF3150_04509 [Pseudomonas aeruginosa]|nr:hypothetical protein HMPREF3150_04509 [Pseudomonas aeruginosa]